MPSRTMSSGQLAHVRRHGRAMKSPAFQVGVESLFVDHPALADELEQVVHCGGCWHELQLPAGCGLGGLGLRAVTVVDQCPMAWLDANCQATDSRERSSPGPCGRFDNGPGTSNIIQLLRKAGRIWKSYRLRSLLLTDELIWICREFCSGNKKGFCRLIRRRDNPSPRGPHDRRVDAAHANSRSVN